MAYNALYKLQDNIAALRIALAYKANDALSDRDLVALRKYAGFGGIKAVLYGDEDRNEWEKKGATATDMRLWEPMQELFDLLREHFSFSERKEIIASLKNSVLTAFYTPAVVPETLYRVLNSKGIRPQRIYEPSAGAGIFVTEAAHTFENITQITAVEKDILTGKVLQAIVSALPQQVRVHISPLEQAPTTDNGGYDLVISNIPFGNFQVYDPDYPETYLAGRIHNYFFAKSLDKLGDGGLLAFITTDGFMNSPGNKEARKYLFRHTDFVSLVALPDNLMKETGGTEAPNHLLIVQKKDNKSRLTDDLDRLLVETVEKDSPLGQFYLNAYIDKYPEAVIGSTVNVDTNQYGKAHQHIWQDGPIEGIGEHLEKVLSDDIGNFLDIQRFNELHQPSQGSAKEQSVEDKIPYLTYTPMPENRVLPKSGVQLGLFDIIAEEVEGRVGAYLNNSDKDTINPLSAKISCILKTTDRPEHETVVLVTAKAATGSRYVSKLFSNAKEIRLPQKWMNGEKLALQLERLAGILKEYGHEYIYQGDPSFEAALQFQKAETDIVGNLPAHYRDNVLYVHNHMAGLLQEIDNEQRTGKFMPFIHPGKNLGFYEHYIALRDNYYDLFSYEHKTGEDAPELRQSLNNKYKSFVATYGRLNQKANSKLILNDQAFGFVLLSSLERRESNGYVPADILKKRLSATPEEFKTENVREALAHCLNEKGDIDVAYISEVTGKEQALVLEELGDQVYFNPQIKDWETADKYLSGNVLEKLRFIEPLIRDDAQDGDMQDRQLLRSYEAIKKVQPQKIPFELLDFNFGERWIPMDYYNRFASDFFELAASIYYLPSIDTFKVKVNGDNAILNTEYTITPKNGRNMYGDTLMEHALKNTSPFFSYKKERPDGSFVRMPDNEATQLAFSKIEAIRQAFMDWMTELPKADKDDIENLYHEKYNCFVLRQYDGSHLTFPGLDLQALGIKELYSSQKNAAWRIIEEKGALIDHIVGLGKTLTMIISAQEMKRIGIIQKPMLTGIKANIPEIAETYRKAYPHARVLYAGPADFTPAKRKRIFHEIKNNDWDCIILSHEQFSAIEQSPEIQKDIIIQEFENLEHDLDTLHSLADDKEISKKELNGLEVRKTNLAAKLGMAIQRIESKKDEDIDFKTMGIDMLFVDESHKFKNLLFSTRHTRVAGLGNQQGSQRALNMLFAARTLQQRYNDDKGVTFLSGTPISNSLTELFLIFKYLRPRALERLDMSHFDGWAAMYARKTTDFEFSVTNEIILKERFRYFIKVPELALLYNEITDYKTDKHIHQDRPELEEVLVNIKPTKDQEEFAKKLMAFARTGNAGLIGLPPLTESEDRARMLIATNYAKKMAVDMRLVNPYIYEDDPGNKLSICAKKFAEVYYAGTEHKVTQMVFSDIGTPKPGQFNVYDALKDKLVSEYHIPAHEIAFIHDWQGPSKRAALYRKMNSGEVRGLFGSTEMAGTGLNVQERLIAEHHLDIPWTPKDLDQRYGRMARPGNIIAKTYYGNKVTAYLYATEKSLDNYKFNLLKNKQMFISQMKNNELQARTLDEGAMDEKSGMNFSEYIAILSGDTSLLEKAKLEKKVKALENLKAAHYKEISKAKWSLEQEQDSYKKAVSMLEHIQKDATVYKNGLRPAKDGSKYNDLKLGTMDSSDPEALGRRLMKIYNQWKPDPGTDENAACIGTIYGFNAMIEHHNNWEIDNGHYQKVEYNKLYAQRPGSKVKYSYNRGRPNMTNPKLAARYFIEAIDRVRSLEEQYLKRVAESERSIPQLTAITVKTFDKEAELAGLKEEMASLERKIAINIQARELENEAMSNGPEEEAIQEPDIDNVSIGIGQGGRRA